MKAVVHVGMGKAGSSTLQATLAANRRVLERWGYHYPKVGGKGLTHNELRLCFDRDRVPRMYAGAADFDPRAYMTALDRELSTVACPTAVLSSEFLFYLRPEGVAALDRFLSERFTDGVVVVAYLREPVSYFLSHQQQVLKGRGELTPPSLSSSGLRTGVQKYRSVFGDRFMVRPAERTQLTGECVAQDFIARYLPDLAKAGPIESVARNESLSAEAMCVLQMVRATMPPEEQGFGPNYKRVYRHLQAISKGDLSQTRPRLRDDIAAFMALRFSGDLDWLSANTGIRFKTAPPSSPSIDEPEHWNSADLRDLLQVKTEDIDRTFGQLVHRLLMDIKRVERPDNAD